MKNIMQGGHRVRFGFAALALSLALSPLLAQTTHPAPPLPTPQSSSSSSSSSSPTAPAPTIGEMSSVRPKNTPAVVNPTGPSISVETSESLFDVMAALNACGYNEGLSISDPVRQKVRDDINQALEQSGAARDSRDRLCGFIRTHTMSSNKLNLAAYISLALYLTPPPTLTPNVAKSDLPPDAAPLIDLASPLRTFAQAINLHVIWALNHAAYDAEVAKAQGPLRRMLVQTDLYLKQPPPTYGPRRFLVILEPLIAPGEMNARVYGGDYIVVESPVDGKIDLKPVKHTYLRFILEPLIYARSKSIDRLTPILELVQPSPMPNAFKSNILSLVTECMIRAIEAHTMATGVPVYTIPAHYDRSQAAAINSADNEYLRKVEDVRRQTVQSDMVQGFILTQYFYQQLDTFPQSDRTLQDAVGEMIYGMNADFEKRRVQNIVFAAHADTDVKQPVSTSSALLDEGENSLIAGDAPAAAKLARQALADHTANPGRAQFLLARAEIMSGQMEPAEQAFIEAAKISHNLRTISWSHIYLGRLNDLEGDRAAAVAQYQLAMKTRDGKPDTRQAAEAGLTAPFSPPQAAQEKSTNGNQGGISQPQN